MGLRLYELAAGNEAIRFSPYCWRIRLALMHKDLEFERVACRLSDKELIAFSGQSQLPVLVHDGHVVNGSWEIATYLERCFPDRPSLFGNNTQASFSRFHCEWVNEVIHPLIFRLVARDVHECLLPQDRSYFRTSREAVIGTSLEAFCADPAAHVAKLRSALAPARKVIGHQPYLGGDHPLYVDYALLAAFIWARSISSVELLEPDDLLIDWSERIMDRFALPKVFGPDCRAHTWDRSRTAFQVREEID